MKEHPIIFNTEMVKAILEGRKTQTRRIIKKPFKIKYPSYKMCMLLQEVCVTETKYGEQLKCPYGGQLKCPYGQVGDRLWVRETWALRTPSFSNHHSRVFFKDKKDKTIYHKDTYEPTKKYGYDLSEKEKWRPSIFMPRWASRITLEITDVRVERVQEIGDAKDDKVFIECRAEGYPAKKYDIKHRGYIEWFVKLWNSIHKKEHRWEDNPWVWVISFKKL